ncbi:hypothetical protein AVEN_261895-1 [Araneus ventricosus]|uniref:Uncharacterized protein n=1 Tax=Araneus ventricosus TaxID=182803 RepID=A0A4Y2KCY6_ARAVE|nr:hypothetical protein AVEN_261895-1 [Araneus ventricosus]
MFYPEQAAFCLNGRYTGLCCFHVSIAVMYLVGLYGYYEVSRKAFTGAPEEYAGFWKYLTYWNLIFHFVFFALSSIFDIMRPECEVYDSILRIRDTAFAGIVFPYGVFVFVMFWGIYIIDRDLIFPKEDEKNFPVWLNHISLNTVTIQKDICIPTNRISVAFKWKLNADSGCESGGNRPPTSQIAKKVAERLPFQFP